MFQYSNQFSHHPKVKIGLKEVIMRLEPDLDRQAKAMNEDNNNFCYFIIYFVFIMCIN